MNQCSQAASDRSWDGAQFRLIFTLSFVVHLAVAVIHRLRPAYWRDSSPHRSVFAEAWARSATTAELAFAG